MNNDRASLSVSVVDSLTASVRVIAPDRPGLMRDITRALTSQGFFIDSATVSTKDGETADNTFTIKLEKKDTTLCDSWKDFTYV
jgi:UTP:GlnB (protein PII) uridylyltransferase